METESDISVFSGAISLLKPIVEIETVVLAELEQFLDIIYWPTKQV